MIKNNIIVIVLIILVFFVFVSHAKLSVRMNLCISSDRAEEIFMDNPLIYKSTLEYKDTSTIILGGRLLGLPTKGNINIQAAIREQEGGCTVVLGYPALPLESY